RYLYSFPTRRSSDLIEQIKAAFLASDEQVWAVVPEFGGRHGHPFVIGREMIEAFLRAPIGSSAREVEHANQSHIRYFPVNDPLVDRKSTRLNSSHGS